jgi:hypothetical protein
MKDYLKEQITAMTDANRALCIIREYLQARILESLQEDGTFSTWAFVGGTALRFLYGMPRFSEDLDFSLSQAGLDDGFTKRMKAAKARFESENYGVTIKLKEQKTVKTAFIKFSGLLYEFGLSPLTSQTVSIKVEIDTNPPAGAGLQTSIIRKHILLNLLHYDKPSLLAGKLHALLARNYVKGRDIYDLMWYLSDRTWPRPNLLLLNNALKQTNWQGPQITADNWCAETSNRLRTFNWDKIVADVKPFIEKQAELDMLSKKNILSLLETR